MSRYHWIERSKKSPKLLMVAILLVTISTDQFTKLLARRILEASNDLAFLNDFVKFSLIQNYSGFLGIVSSLSSSMQFFLLTICVSVLLLGCLGYLLFYPKRTTRYDALLATITGGGASNLLDRFLHNGGVTDFLSLGFGTLRTGIFNLADVYILVGSFLVGFSFFGSLKTRKQSATDA